MAAGLGLFASGVLVGAAFLGDLGEVPCNEVLEQAQPVRDVMTDSFGVGEEGRQAMRDMLAIVQDNPGCFEPGAAEMLESSLQTPVETGTLQETPVEPTAGASESG